ncbi:Zn-ribbon domain-containing OB-fold protein [Spirillospora sp. CA-294931]|uniref:Zn-ribbon domain-containing OB-fold protein n=1 Tax=Spirillospora sp. CA-294931 TaxID=3240042 RepID=UPI003D8AC799
MSDRDSAAWWDAVRRHELTLQRCAACREVRFPPRAMCNRCGAESAEWVPALGTGRVYSWVVTHQVFAPALAGRVPYTTLLVRLDDGPDLLMYGNLAEGAPADLRPGLPVEAVFEDAEDGTTLINWRPRP